MTTKKTLIIPGLIILLVCLALVVRLIGIGWGLPYIQYHVDEQGFGKFTIHYFTGDLDPHFFEVPSLYTYLTAAVWEGYYLGGKIAGKFTDHASFIKAYGRDSSVFILLGRLLTVLFSVGTALLVFAVGRRMYGTRAGALAALMLVFSLEHVKQSHYYIPDVAMVFFMVLSFFFIWSIYTTGKARYYILAGLFAGLAYATKYSGHFLALPLLLAHFFRASEEKEPFLRSLFSPKLLGALLAFFGGFLAGCPYAVLDSHKFLRDFRRQASRLFAEGHFGSSTSEPTWLFYLKYGLRENVGRAAQFLVPGGVLYALYKHRKKDILLLSLPVTLFIIMGTMKSYATRYLLPLAPFFILLAALFLDKILDWIKAGAARLKKARLATVLSKPAQAVLVLAVLLPSAVQVARYDESVTWTDTRTVAKNWIEANIPRGERIASESYRPPLKAEDYQSYTPNCLGDVTWDWLVQRRIKYVIVNDVMYQRFLDTPKDFPKEAAFYKSLDKQAYLLKTFAPRRDEDLIDLHNPTIKIYRLSVAPNPAFPGAFRQFRESVRVTTAASGRWAIKASVEASGPPAPDEKPGRAYLRLVGSAGREVWRSPLGDIPLSASPDLHVTAALDCPAPTEPVSIYIGYGSTLSPALRSEKIAPSIDKEILLAGPLTPQAVASAGLESDYFYAQMSDTTGDRYFQSATLTGEPAGFNVASTILGGRLRGASSAVVGPFVKITDATGREVGRLVLSAGTVGGLDATQKVPLTAKTLVPALPENFRVFFGCDAFMDQGAKPVGPQEFEVLPARR